MPGDQSQDEDQGEGGPEAQPEDHVGQPGPQGAVQVWPAGSLVRQAPGGDTTALTHTQGRVPVIVSLANTVLPQGTELSGPRNISLSLSLSLSP